MKRKLPERLWKEYGPGMVTLHEGKLAMVERENGAMLLAIRGCFDGDWYDFQMLKPVYDVTRWRPWKPSP